MKKILAVVMMVILVLSLAGCGEVEKELANIGEYEGCVLELLDATVISRDDGVKVLRVSATYTNNNEDPLYAYCSFAVKAFQNDVELTECSDINGDEAVLIQEVKNGKSLSVAFVFELSDESPVEVYVCTPTASQDIIARQNYLEPEAEVETT